MIVGVKCSNNLDAVMYLSSQDDQSGRISAYKYSLSDNDVFNPSKSLYMFPTILSLYQKHEGASASDVELASMISVTTGTTEGKVELKSFYLAKIPLQLNWLENLESKLFKIELSEDRVIMTASNGHEIAIDTSTGLLLSDKQPGGLPRVTLVEIKREAVDLSIVSDAIIEKASSFPAKAKLIVGNEIGLLKQINEALPPINLENYLENNHLRVRDAMYEIGRTIYISDSKEEEVRGFITDTAKMLVAEGIGSKQWPNKRLGFVEMIKAHYFERESKEVDGNLKHVSIQDDSLDIIKRICLPMIVEGYAEEITTEMERQAGLHEIVDQ